MCLSGQEDKYWIIRVESDCTFKSPFVESCDVEVVIAINANFEMWQKSPGIAKMFKVHNAEDRWLGRRINDEIELFDDEGDEVSSTCLRLIKE